MMTRKSELMVDRKPKFANTFQRFITSQYAIDEQYKRYHMKLVDGEYIRTYIFKWTLTN